jgi:phenylalanyl-tRNA synthetase beta chain
MIVSHKWLQQYVPLNMPHDDLIHRLTMSGLNYDGTTTQGDDLAINLEVTSNRPDCLGHLGVAREISVLYDLPLSIPNPTPPCEAEQTSSSFSIEIQTPTMCPRYSIRVIRGVKIGISPEWMQQQLEAVGITPVNNVVDCTNYVMLESGQPLHAFDLAKLRGSRIIVREPLPNETMKAIDHRIYPLSAGMCIISDAERAVAIGGVMGGADSEVSESTRDIVIETAVFDPLSVRNAARRLNLHSPSSYRFERGVDFQGTEWASRRCSELILKTAGGRLLDGTVDVSTRNHSAGNTPRATAGATQQTKSHSITLRWAQVDRVLGILPPRDFMLRALQKLGLEILEKCDEQVTVVAPSWRRDLQREIDLVEEVGRIYGYEHVPDNAAVPLAPSHRPAISRVLDKVRRVMTACGFDEAMTTSLVPQIWCVAFSPWSNNPALESNQPMLGVLEKASQNIGSVNLVRRSLIPSLLEAKRINEYRSNESVELFETAKVYLPRESGLPDEPQMLGVVSSRDFSVVKGILESLVQFVAPQAKLLCANWENELLDVSQAANLTFGGDRLGVVGRVSPLGKKMFGLRQDAVVAELDLGVLERFAVLIPTQSAISEFPPVHRDFNFVLPNEVPWSALAEAVHTAGGPLLETVRYRETFRDETKDGPGKKRVLLSVMLRSPTGTLTGEQLDSVSHDIVSKCQILVGASVMT